MHDYQEIEDEMMELVDKVRRLQNEKQVMTNRAKTKAVEMVSVSVPWIRFLGLP